MLQTPHTLRTSVSLSAPSKSNSVDDISECITPVCL